MTTPKEQAAEERARTRFDRVQRLIHKEDGHVRLS
jgi:hypothetical protein